MTDDPHTAAVRLPEETARVLEALSSRGYAMRRAFAAWCEANEEGR